MGKSTNIVRWVVFGVLALITLVVAVLYYLGISHPEQVDHWAGFALNWSYILVGLGVLLFVVSFIFVIIISIMKGVQTIKAISLGATAAILVIFAVIALLVSAGKIDSALNFFYLIFGISLVIIIVSAIYSLITKRA